MTTIGIIGTGNMAIAIGTRAAKHGHTIEVMSRTTAKAEALADHIGSMCQLTANGPCPDRGGTAGPALLVWAQTAEDGR